VLLAFDMNAQRSIRIQNQGYPLRAVAFDLDSTLTKPYLDFTKLRAQLGLTEGDILNWLAGLPPDEKQQANQTIEAFEQDGVDNVEWNDGAEHTLQAIQALGLPVAIITRNSHTSVCAVCQHLGIQVDLLIAREDAPPKPDPASLHLVAQQFDVTPETIVMVGDFRHDTEAGRAAGTWTVLLTNGRKPYWRVEADIVIARLPELLGYLE
jgi:HAD superfamily hydrolase (TIGR01509 family)